MLFAIPISINFQLHSVVVHLHCRPRIAANVVAAWRSGGFHCRSSGVLPFNFALPLLRASCRRCAKPLVVRSAFYFFLVFYAKKFDNRYNK
jgi:hypothetical protein